MYILAVKHVNEFRNALFCFLCRICAQTFTVGNESKVFQSVCGAADNICRSVSEAAQ